MFRARCVFAKALADQTIGRLLADVLSAFLRDGQLVLSVISTILYLFVGVRTPSTASTEKTELRTRPILFHLQLAVVVCTHTVDPRREQEADNKTATRRTFDREEAEEEEAE